MILSDFEETGGGTPYLGDYADLIAVGETFYGIFSARNFPALRNFPQGVTYQREVDFTTNRLLDLDGSVVRESTDPFFFTVSNEICNPRRQPCFSSLWDCRPAKLEPGKIVIDKCLLHPCIVVDPVPQNCLIKFDCPGCSKTTLCAPYHHIYLEDFDTNVWSADISTFKNEDVNYTINKINNGIVISFKPSEKNFRQKDIGDYNLTFQSLSKKVVNKKYIFKTKLEVSDYPYNEHLKHK